MGLPSGLSCSCQHEACVSFVLFASLISLWTHGCSLPLTAGGRHRTAATYDLSDPASTPHGPATTEETGKPLAISQSVTSDALEHVNLHMIQRD